MKKRKNSSFIICIFFVLIMLKSFSSQIVSPFNKREIKDTSRNYSFLVSGHFYGAFTNASSFPASTLQGSIDTLNSLNPLFLMSLGDMFMDANVNEIKNYRKSFFDKIHFPLLNAVGNHDLSNGNIYETFFGKSFFSFSIHSELFIVLNTEVNDGSIKNEQLDFLKRVLYVDSLKKIKNIFIFSHRPVWAERMEKYAKIFPFNTHTAIGTNNYTEIILPLLKQVSVNKNTYWISGSLGGGESTSFFYDRDESTNITFMQSAIRDLPRDAVLLININDSKISLKGISLTGQNLEPIENYNLTYWNKHARQETNFNFRLLPLYTKQMLLHYYFWLGFLFCLFFVVFIFLVRKKRKQKY